MSEYQLINGCQSDETLSIFSKLMSYPALKLDMGVLPDGSGHEAVVCTFNYEGLKMGLEIFSHTDQVQVCCFIYEDLPYYFSRYPYLESKHSGLSSL